MCRGLAVIAHESPSGWIVEAKEGVSSHDILIHGLSDDLKHGIQKYLKFEVLFPRSITCDIDNELKDYYPEHWLVEQWGKKRACDAAYAAVECYLLHRPNLLKFGTKMLQNANLSRANLSRANLSRADLSRANLSSANLSSADLSSADLMFANLSFANLSSANLSSADLSRANLYSANLSSANLSSAKLPEITVSCILKDAIMPDGKLYDGSWPRKVA
jgi:hypothetical protein